MAARGRCSRGFDALTQPLTVVTDAGTRGAWMVALLFAAIAAASLPYGWMLARKRAPPLAAQFAIGIAALAIAWCSPVLFSSDVYAYAAYGELARLGLNPYAYVAPMPGDVLISDAMWQWNGTLPICVYGPGFVAIASAVVALLAPLGALAQLQGMRVLDSVALLGCIALAYAGFGGKRGSGLRAAAVICLNPVAIWCAAEGHNDALALAATLAGFALVRANLPTAGGALTALSALIKSPGAAAATGLAVSDRRARIGAALGLTVAIAVSFPLIAAAATRVLPHGQYAPQASLQAAFALLGGPAAIALSVVIAAGLAAHALALARARRDEGWIWLGLAAWALIPNPYPWYALWLTALAALAPKTRAATVAILLSFTSLLRYVPDAIAAPSPPIRVALGILAALPFAALLI